MKSSDTMGTVHTSIYLSVTLNLVTLRLRVNDYLLSMEGEYIFYEYLGPEISLRRISAEREVDLDNAC